MSLLDLQRRTMQAVTRPLTNDYRMRARTADKKSMYVEAAEFIKPNDRLSSFERLEIYNRQYWFRIIGALTEDFPGLAALLGDRQFDRVAVDYLIANPSKSFTLRNLGHNLEAWLAEYPQELPVDRALLLDVARLEWAHIEAFDNAELPRLSPERVGEVAESGGLTLQPHVRLLSLAYPVDNFVVAIHHDEDEPSMASNAVAQRPVSRRKRYLSKLQPEQIFLAVHRHDEFVYYKRLDEDAYRILTGVASGVPLADALEQAAEQSTDEAFIENIPGWFALWGQLGWLAEKPTTAEAESSSHDVEAL